MTTYKAGDLVKSAVYGNHSLVLGDHDYMVLIEKFERYEVECYKMFSMKGNYFIDIDKDSPLYNSWELLA